VFAQRRPGQRDALRPIKAAGRAAAVLKAVGLTVSDAFRLLLVRVAAEKALPFEPLVPNAETVEAMKAARRGELVKAGKPEKLLGRLKAGDQGSEIAQKSQWVIHFA
jgi:DNA-damage-inducible protein J